MTPIEPGFDDPTTDAQSAFRAVMAALAEPGTIRAAAVTLTPPLGLGRAACALLLALLDDTTPLAVIGGDPGPAAYFQFHTGAPAATSLDAASFVLARGPLARPRLDALAWGDPAYPDRSATLIIEVASLCVGMGRWRLSGPGIADHRLVSVEGIDPDFVTEWARNGEAFPRGVDVLFASGDDVMALPRSTKLEIV